MCQKALLLPVMGHDPVDDIHETSLRAETGQGMKLIDAGNTTHHVFESWLIGFVVRNIVDRRGTVSPLRHHLGEILNGDFFRISNIDDFADGALQREQS